jgi:hypothetical protein
VNLCEEVQKLVFSIVKYQNSILGRECQLKERKICRWTKIFSEILFPKYFQNFIKVEVLLKMQTNQFFENFKKN